MRGMLFVHHYGGLPTYAASVRSVLALAMHCLVFMYKEAGPHIST
jgi:hypothetical protein